MTGDGCDDEAIQFLDEDEPAPATSADQENFWLVAVIDDETAVFDATELALRGLKFDGRPIRLLQARSAAAGKALLAATPDIACVLLDVVMESDHAGLDLVRAIREELANDAIRIVLRTGQPGYAPPLDVIQRYDINDYKEKTELTQTLLWTSIACALRSYQQLRQLEHGRKGMRAVLDASARLMRRHDLQDFYRSALTELAAHLDEPVDGLLYVRPSGRGTGHIVGAAGRFRDHLGLSLDRLHDKTARQAIDLCLAEQTDGGGATDAAFHLGGPTWDGVVYLAGRTTLDTVRRDLLQLLSRNIALGIENARLIDHVSGLAYIDSVTGLASRPRIEQTLRDMIARGLQPSALVVNIDGFSNYTTGLGDSFGHALLQAFAARLLALHPHPDRVGCLYRDVFCVVLEDRADSATLQQALDATITIDEQKLRLGLRFGLSAPLEPDTAPADLIRQAEIAARSTAHSLRRGVPTFTVELEQAHRSRAFLAHDLRDALENGEVSLAYQPQVDAKTHGVIGAEALMRWQHPKRGPIPPSEFIEVAETSGLIGDVGRWVTRRACREMKPLIEAGLLGRVMINLSPVQLRDPECMAELTAIVAEEGVPFSAIEWEITESATLGGGGVLAQLEAARAVGFTIALDDFGTGYSSLSMIRNLPLNVVKIDRSFLLEVATSQHAWSILFSIASICEDLGLDMVAEGVETTAQLKMVRDANIGTLQGYLVSRPLSAEKFTAWLNGLGK
jgi:EAL domain-containing protein (putative c-di-GMP-specific phosphodiesterase class I)/GGDEF domain-containing protein/FixJ family two-component response regulator